MDEKLRPAILQYEFKSQRSTREAVSNIGAVFGLGSVSKSTAGYWFKRFASGCKTLEDLPRASRPSNFDSQALKKLMEPDLIQSQEEIAMKLGVSKQAICAHLKQLGKTKTLDKWVS
ncbi:hypothetical protein M514_07940, partial [Trichuris suis]